MDEDGLENEKNRIKEQNEEEKRKKNEENRKLLMNIVVHRIAIDVGNTNNQMSDL